MRVWLRNILLFTAFFLFALACKKENKNEPITPAPPSITVPCNANNLVVDSIIEITGQSKIYKLTIINHTITQSNSTISAVAGVYQVTMTVLGDTMLNSILGKRYKIQRTNNPAIKAYSYLNPSDSLWHLIPYDNNESLVFNVVIKLPIVPSSTYAVISNSNTYTNFTDSAICISVNYQTYPLFPVTSVAPFSFPNLYTRTFNINKSGLMSWSYTDLTIQTQNPYQTTHEWQLERIN